jgi:hypothetical protein
MSEGKKIDFGISRTEIFIFICETISILFFGLFTDFWDGGAPTATTLQDAEIAKYVWDKYPSF